MTDQVISIFHAFFANRVYILAMSIFLVSTFWLITKEKNSNIVIWNFISYIFMFLIFFNMTIYLITPNFLDYAEPLMTVMAGNFLAGSDLYNDIRHEESSVSSLYGPLIFLLQALFTTISPTVAASKLPGIAAGALSLVISYKIIRKFSVDRCTALFFVTICALFLYSHRHYWFWNRPDSFLILLTSISMMIYYGNKIRPELFIPVITGIAINLKLHAAIYMMPAALVYFWGLPGWKAIILTMLRMSAITLLVAAIPFLIPGISLPRFLENLAFAARHGLDGSIMLESLAYVAAYLAVPGALYLSIDPEQRRPEDGVALLGLTGASLLMVVASGKPGSGSPHLMPFVPVAMILAARIASGEAIATGRVARFLRLNLVAAAAAAGPVWAYSVYEIHKWFPDFQRERAIAAEARAFFTAYPGTEMAHAGESFFAPITYHRVQGSFAGNVIRFDIVNLMDLHFAGVLGGHAAGLLRDCRIPSWIAPRGMPIFANSPHGRPLFDEAFREAFFANYRVQHSGQFFDLWICDPTRRSAGPQAALQSGPDHAVRPGSAIVRHAAHGRQAHGH